MPTLIDECGSGRFSARWTWSLPFRIRPPAVVAAQILRTGWKPAGHVSGLASEKGTSVRSRNWLITHQDNRRCVCAKTTLVSTFLRGAKRRRIRTSVRETSSLTCRHVPKRTHSFFFSARRDAAAPAAPITEIEVPTIGVPHKRPSAIPAGTDAYASHLNVLSQPVFPLNFLIAF